jgi:hypothetical protein
VALLEGQVLVIRLSDGSSAVTELLGSCESLRDVLERERLVVVEVEVGETDIDWAESPEHLGREAEQAMRQAVLELPPNLTPLFLLHTRITEARLMPRARVRAPGGLLLGVCGYLEGGATCFDVDGGVMWERDFLGTDSPEDDEAYHRRQLDRACRYLLGVCHGLAGGRLVGKSEKRHDGQVD